MRRVNHFRPLPVHENQLRRFANAAAFLCFAPWRILDWLLVRRFSTGWTRKLGREHDAIRNAEEQIQMDDISLRWTTDTAFLVLSGGCVHRSRDLGRSVVQKQAILWLAENEPEALLPLQRTMLQNPSKANAIAKAITCVQALWFCLQCVARLSQNLAVSLLELNTFAHCVSTLLIYLFWWDKPYEVESHVLLQSSALDLERLALLNYVRLRITTYDACDAHLPNYHRLGSGLCQIIDPNGNHIMDQYWEHSNGNSVTGPANDILLSTDYQSGQAKIPGTGFLMSGLPIEGANQRALFLDGDDLQCWQRLWLSWLRSGCPLPKKPIKRHRSGALWFSDRTRNMNEDALDLITVTVGGPFVIFVMTFTCALYGGLHLLAWQYEFGSKAEGLLWRIASVVAASSGVVLLQMNVGGVIAERTEKARLIGFNPVLRFLGRACNYFGQFLLFSATPSMIVSAAARTFLVIESFKALPNSPASTYVIPNWTAYMPHI